MGSGLKSIIPDILIIFGVGSIAYGFYLINEPYGFVSAGILTLFIGVFAARKNG